MKIGTPGFAARITALVIAFTSLTIAIMAGLGYAKLYGVTEQNASIRIDRASRAAASILSHAIDGEFEIIRNDEGRPQAIRIASGTPDSALNFRQQHDEVLAEIGAANQGAANLFRLNPQTNGFDRFATTFRKPDGSMPPAMSISQGHPAWSNLFANKPHVGEVPVMNRLRLAYLTPIQAPDGTVAGALAVDVGWVDDLIVARNELTRQIAGGAIGITLLVIIMGTLWMRSEMKPLRVLSGVANRVASGEHITDMPYRDRTDEVGALSMGLSRVAELQKRLSVLAYTDELTGIGNRARYLADLEEHVKNSLSGESRSFLLHIDLDKFKETNDAFGQSAGDALMRIIADILKDSACENSAIARLSGDQFTLLCNYDGDQENIYTLAKNILSKVSKPHILRQGEVQITASIGIVTMPLDAKSLDEAHLNADLSLRQAKANGGNCMVMYNKSMNTDLQNQLQMERYLREAIEARDFHVHYQPQIDPTDNSLQGLEALARWQHDELGYVGPDQFIPIAESTGLIVDLGAIIMDKTCRQVRAWLDEGFDFKHVSINVSPVQLWQTDFVQQFHNALLKYDIDGKYICLEVTESVFIDHSEGRVNEIFQAIQNLGVRLSLDDFGSGYSSLGYLNRLQFDQFKIDRSFVTGVDKDPNKFSLLAGIVGLGRGLDLEIVCEGAETEGEVMAISSIGCRSIQGFYFAKPAPAEQIGHVVSDLAAMDVMPEAKSA
jgi:diguanylate cyclase (GGDEF)-like protein